MRAAEDRDGTPRHTGPCVPCSEGRARQGDPHTDHSLCSREPRAAGWRPHRGTRGSQFITPCTHVTAHHGIPWESCSINKHQINPFKISGPVRTSYEPLHAPVPVSDFRSSEAEAEATLTRPPRFVLAGRPWVGAVLAFTSQTRTRGTEGDESRRLLRRGAVTSVLCLPLRPVPPSTRLEADARGLGRPPSPGPLCGNHIWPECPLQRLRPTFPWIQKPLVSGENPTKILMIAAGPQFPPGK